MLILNQAHANDKGEEWRRSGVAAIKGEMLAQGTHKSRERRKRPRKGYLIHRLIERYSDSSPPRRYADTPTRPYPIRRRKNQVATVKVNTAMTAIGQMFAHTSAAGRLFRKSPLTITIMYRNGLA